jgi:hypothetical protein
LQQPKPKENTKAECGSLNFFFLNNVHHGTPVILPPGYFGATI